MITPRRTRLVRVADLQAFRRVLARLALAPAADARVVVVPSRAAARQLARTAPRDAWPDLVTRDQLYDRLQARLERAPERLTPFAREAAMRAAAARAADAGAAPPFALRPGLVAEIVRFYDQLRRQRQSVDRFETLLTDSLAGNPDDRGAQRLLRQTAFLAATYRAYDAELARRGALDEHALRDRLIASAAADPIRHVMVAVGDWIADPDGLFPADFDLLTRLPGLEAIDVVATSGTLASGFHQRIHDWLPGLEETDATGVGGVEPSSTPVLRVPEPADVPFAFLRRDREEELAAVARELAGPGAQPSAVAFARPLPYLYVAPEVFGGAHVAYASHDALPLAAEPYAAAVDLAIEFALTAFTRSAGVALLRSPHFEWSREDRAVTRESVAALDRLLSESRYLGELERLRSLPEWWRTTDSVPAALVETAAPAFDAMREAAAALAPLTESALLSAQVARVAAFLERYARTGEARADRARAAVATVLQAIGAAYATHGDPPSTIEGVASEVRRWLEDETFVPETPEASLQLLDAQAARFADVARLFVVGLIEGEWPERARRNIFYPPGLLAALGWPSEADRRGANLAAFVDLLRSPSGDTTLSTFKLDDEALVEPAVIIEEAGNAGLPIATVGADASPRARVFDDEWLALDPVEPAHLGETARGWAALRLSRTPAADTRYHGEAGPRPLARLSVSAVETYLTCPFKYFARYVLKLEDEPDDDEVMDPKRQGQFVHAVFEAFFKKWDATHGGSITPESLDEAYALFDAIAGEHLSRLPESEAALERTRLLGSAVAPGLADAVFRMEAERPVEVVERRLEYKLEGDFTFAGPNGPRTLNLKGFVDRIDLLADGTFRLIDYKLGRAPNRSRALQLPVYAICAEQRLGGPRLSEAAYIAFREPKRVVGLVSARSDQDAVLASASERLVTAVEAIEAGHFPPTPEDVFLCGFCGYGAVCRKDYVE